LSFELDSLHIFSEQDSADVTSHFTIVDMPIVIGDEFNPEVNDLLKYVPAELNFYVKQGFKSNQQTFRIVFYDTKENIWEQTIGPLSIEP